MTSPMREQLLSAEEGRTYEETERELLVDEILLPKGSPEECHDERSNSLCTWRPCLFGFARCYRFRNSHNTVGTVLLSLGLVCLILAACLCPLADFVVSTSVDEAVVTDSHHADSYKTWESNTRKNSQPVDFDVHIFDIANVDDMLYHGAKPALVEKGPYSYKELFEKFDVKFMNGGKKVSFYQNWYYVFNEKKSGPGLNPSDRVRTPNLVASGLKAMLEAAARDPSGVLAAPERLRGYQQILRHPLVASAVSLGAQDHEDWRGLLKMILCTGDEASPITTLPMNDVYWGFFGDPVLEALGDLLADSDEDIPWSTYVPGVSSNYSSRAEVVRRSNRHLYRTGKSNVNQVDQVIRYANMSEQYLCAAVGAPGATWDDEAGLPPACKAFNHEWTEEEAAVYGWTKVWGSDDANRIYGTDASQYTPGKYERDSLPTYISDIYRSTVLGFVKEYTWKGIRLRRYGLRASDLYTSNCKSTTGGIDDANHCNPANADFYSFSTWGVLNFTTVGGGVPLFASKPHFLTGDPWLVSHVSGLEPNGAVHETYLDIEPVTGYTFRAAKRLQLGAIIDDWNMPSLPLDGYFGLNETVVQEYKKEAVKAIVHLAEEELVHKLEDRLNETVDEWCQHSTEHREAHCAAVIDDVERAVDARCQSEHGCPVVAELRQAVNATEHYVQEIKDFCHTRLGRPTCAKAADEIQQAITSFCNASSIASEACHLVQVVANDVEQFWDTLETFCHHGLCRTRALQNAIATDESCQSSKEFCDTITRQPQPPAAPTPEVLLQASRWAASRSNRPEYRAPAHALHQAILGSIANSFNFTGERARQYDACLKEPSNFTIPESTYYVPVAWVDEHFDLQEKDVNAFKDSVQGTLTLAQVAAFWLYVLAAGFATSGLVWFASVKYWVWATPAAQKAA